MAALTPLAHVSEVVSPFSAAGAHQISTDGHIAYVQVVFDQQAGDLPRPPSRRWSRPPSPSPRPGTTWPWAARPSAWWPEPSPGSSEGIGILAAIIIMLLAFGSVVAMGLPIITALFGIAIAFAVLDLLTHVITRRPSPPRCWP